MSSTSIESRGGDPATQVFFDVRLDDAALPTFTAVDGLSAEFEIEEVKEGGNNEFVHRLTGRIKYPNLKLTRAVDSHSPKLAAWFTKTSDGAPGSGTAVITAYSGDLKPIAKWTLRGALPVKYTGPSFTATGTAIATESLELVHNGFTFESGS